MQSDAVATLSRRIAQEFVRNHPQAPQAVLRVAARSHDDVVGRMAGTPSGPSLAAQPHLVDDQELVAVVISLPCSFTVRMPS